MRHDYKRLGLILGLLSMMAVAVVHAGVDEAVHQRSLAVPGHAAADADGEPGAASEGSAGAADAAVDEGEAQGDDADGAGDAEDATDATSPPRTIPLASIYTSSWQEGLQRIQRGPELRAERGPAVLQLAWARDFDQLTKAKRLSLSDHDEPLRIEPPDDAKAQLWVGVYFGATGSRPVQYVIESVTVHDGRIDLVYTRPFDGIMTRDLVPYFAWIPVGRPAPGRYTFGILEGKTARASSTFNIQGPRDQAGIVFDWTLINDTFHLEVKNNTTKVFQLDPFYAEGATITLTALNARFESIYTTDFAVDVDRELVIRALHPGRYHRTLYNLASRLKSLPDETRYIRLTWNHNVGTELASPLTTSLFDVKQAVPMREQAEDKARDKADE